MSGTPPTRPERATKMRAPIAVLRATFTNNLPKENGCSVTDGQGRRSHLRCEWAAERLWSNTWNSELRLNRLHRHHPQSIHQAYFFLEERLAVLHARQHAVEVRHGGNALADFGVGKEVFAAGGLVGELLCVGVDGFKLGFELGGDVHDKRGTNVVVESGVHDLERAERLMIAQAMDFERVHVGGGGGMSEAAQSGEEAGLVTQRGASVVIGRSALPVGQDHRAWALLANHARDLDAVGVGVLDPAVGNVERLPPRDLQDACCVSRLSGSAFGGAPRGPFALR